MIIEDEGNVICHYNENENLPNVEGVGISTLEYMTNREKIYE